MAWLQKRPQVGDGIQFYSMSLNKSLLIVGLGNPGAEYDGSRHNIGFACLDAYVAATDGFEAWTNKKSLHSLFTTARIGDTRVYAIKPTTFMNLSGKAVQAVAAFYKIPVENIVVVHDELDVDFGHIRLRTGGSAAGHNGIKSITEQMGEGYGRIRIGIGPKHPARIKSESFVLQMFDKNEQAQTPNLIKETSAILSEYSYSAQIPTETRTFIV